MMKENDLQKKYSLRKFKGIGLASAVIGVLFANQSVYAGVTSGDRSETTVITGADNERVTEKIPASHKTTFTDDKDSTKKVTVDAVIGNVTFEPKANEHFGDPDGTDRVNFSKKATVNYLLEEDHSKITESKIYEEKGNVYANYDKKGISYDTDGKAYRGSGVEIIRGEINENTGSDFHLKANNKAYQLVRSEVVDKEKAVYEKTHFNDIEASVSPEGMYNYLGEINYGKITGKVYLVEETTDGHYGKYVEASNITSDEEAVKAWKNGQTTAKDFTKENVTLQEGDTILVMDRDTYAHGSGGRKVHSTDYRREKIAATPAYDKVEPFERSEGIQGNISYAFWGQPMNGEYPTMGNDEVFGTSDDGKASFNGDTVLFYSNASKSYPPGFGDLKEHNFKKESLKEIIGVMHAEVYAILEYFNQNTNSEEVRQDIQARKAKLDENIASTIEMIRKNNINVSVESDKGLMFSQDNKDVLKQLRAHIETGENVLKGLNLEVGSTSKILDYYYGEKNVTLTEKQIVRFGPSHAIESGYIRSYHKDAVPEHYSDWKKDDEREEREVFVYANKGVVTISDDLKHINVVDENKTTTETEFTKQEVTTTKVTDYEVKELITPIRAYKVMGEGNPVVNHYYKMVSNRAMIPSLIHDEKVGTITVQYVSNTGEKLKSDEIVAGEVPYKILKTYDLISGTTKVGEDKVFETLMPDYDATEKKHDTIIADKTGFTYEFDEIAFGSAPEIGVIDKPQTIVKYVYRLVSKEDPNPVKKEVKGSVMVKYVDAEGNEIKPAETLVNDAVLRTTYTYITKSGDKVVSTRDEVGEWHIPNYNAKDKWHEKITTADGKTYDYHGIYAVSKKFNNTTAETGKVVEGITTVVYQYELVKPSWKIPADSPKEEVPEFIGGTSVPEAPTHDIPEFNGGVVAIEPPIYSKPTLIITKWVDEDGIQLRPADVKEPVVLGQPNEAFEHGIIEGYEYIETIRNQEGDVVTHKFRKQISESKESNTSRGNSENEEQKNENIIIETPKDKDVSRKQKQNEEVTSEKSMDEYQDSTSDKTLDSTSILLQKTSQLPQTGTGDELALVSAATSAVLAGIGFVKPKKKQ